MFSAAATPEAKQAAAPALLAAFCLMLTLAPQSLIAHLEFDRHAILGGEFWRLWSGHLVHYSLQHASVDAAVLLLAGVMAARAAGGRRLWAALALGAPLISAGLLLIAPGLWYYRGASALGVMLTVLAGALLWAGAGRRLRAALALLALALTAKIAAEALGLAQGWSDLPRDVGIVWQAHLMGVAAGLAAGAWAACRPRRAATVQDAQNRQKAQDVQQSI
jgi:rhomboid family GlyGly-CTERM serine protease